MYINSRSWTACLCPVTHQFPLYLHIVNVPFTFSITAQIGYIELWIVNTSSILYALHPTRITEIYFRFKYFQTTQQNTCNWNDEIQRTKYWSWTIAPQWLKRKYLCTELPHHYIPPHSFSLQWPYIKANFTFHVDVTVTRLQLLQPSQSFSHLSMDTRGWSFHSHHILE